MKNRELSSLKVAIVHDWLVGGGAELVVYELHKMFPDAPVYTSYCTDEWRAKFDGKVKTGWLQHFGKVRKYIPFLRIWWFTHLKFDGYDLVISSSGAEAKGIKVPTETLHINYCHAPTHYYWSRYQEYMEHPGFGAFDPLARLGLKLLVGPLRKWDYKAAQRPNYMIANSTHIQQEIKKYYGRDSTVIFPPVDISRFESSNSKDQSSRSGFLAGGRLTPYKRVDLAVQACTKLDLPLTVYGDGPDRKRLETIAGPSVKFAGFVSNDEVVRLLQTSAAYIFALLDDFGIASIEALASGTPVIAYGAGGALNYIEPGKTGEFFEPQTVEALANTLKNFDPKKYKESEIKESAKKFSTENFQKQMTEFLEKTLD
ncbi:MAG TPA: glycosyltransferase [Candidatus Saccharimonadales bacterium]|nr:glycosyltransferase [Candidatus Saccharimonadales bacterium]